VLIIPLIFPNSNKKISVSKPIHVRSRTRDNKMKSTKAEGTSWLAKNY